MIITSNNYESLDPALIRPGRMDIHIELQKCSKIVTLQLLEHFYEIDYITLHKKYSSMIIEYKYSPAEINQICFKNRTNIEDCIKELYN